MIFEATPLKNGNGKELRQLHDTEQHHFCALKSMDCKLSDQFITSLLELKLDANTMFEWQKHSKEKMEYSSLTCVHKHMKHVSDNQGRPKKHEKQLAKKTTTPSKSVTFFTATVGNSCPVCKTKQASPVCVCYVQVIPSQLHDFCLEGSWHFHELSQNWSF